jgi:hypothetical protein
MDGMPYNREDLEELAKKTEYELLKISQFLEKMEEMSKNAGTSLRFILSILNKDNIPSIVTSKKSKKEQKIQKEQILQNRQKIQILQEMIFPHISKIERSRLESERGILIACETFDKLIQKGYTDEMIKQAVFNATRDEFWSRQFRSLAKLLRKNRDEVLYIDIFLAIGVKNHKISIPKIVR